MPYFLNCAINCMWVTENVLALMIHHFSLIHGFSWLLCLTFRIEQIFSIFQPQLILLQIISEIRWKKNQTWLTFNYFCDLFLIYHNKFQWKPQGYEKKIQRTPKWNKNRVLFCSNNINKSQSFQFSQVLLTELSSLHDSTVEIFSTCVEGQICWRLSYWHLWSRSKTC